jgi:hypothetical protein
MDHIEELIEEQDVHINHDSSFTTLLHNHGDIVLAH